MPHPYAKVSRPGTHPIIARTLRTLLEQARGQMLRKTIQPQLFIFKRTRTLHLHTFFVRQPLDILFINRALQVTRKETIKPNRILAGSAHYLLEMQAHTCPYLVGDTLHITFEHHGP